MEHRKLPEGCSLDSVPGDGNCLVASLGKGIAFQKQAKAPVPASQLRAELVAYMSRDKQKTRLSEFWDGLDADGKHKLASFDAYLESLQKPGAWMGNLELSSAADLFGLTIYVVPRNVLHPPIKFGVGAYPIALFYSGIPLRLHQTGRRVSQRDPQHLASRVSRKGDAVVGMMMHDRWEGPLHRSRCSRCGPEAVTEA